MQTDVLIIGQGLCGTMLSWQLYKEGKNFLVIDDNAENASSKVAAGIINPVTGRRYVHTWMVEELMEFVQIAYKEFGDYLDKQLLNQKSIIDFFPSPQMRNAFVDRISENDTFLHSYPDQNRFNQYFNYDFGCGEIRPAYTVNVQVMLSAWRKKLQELNSLKEEKFIAEDLSVTSDGVNYQGITAQKVIFCDGISSAQNPWFSLLPFSANKGEALIIECRELTNEHIYKRGMLLTPLPEENTFWVGSNYQWEFEDDQPSEKFYTATTQLLNGWLKKPYTVISHKAAVRPATVERRPFVGFHPVYPSIGILNGMGTKGTSLAPFFAHQLAQHIVYNFPLAPEADVHRFQRILSK
ncbi:MAG: FAD-binding oxidoreductase [Chitinophagaceae bacterium]|nr:MAG: FAD-binding oxidoreductase [Chitinophagaceae bacterium]